MDEYLSPTAMATAGDSKTLFIACASTKGLLSFDAGTRRVLETIPLPGPASGLAASADGRWLFVTCPGPQSQVLGYELDCPSPPVCRWSVHAGHTAMAPVASLDGRRLYVCNRFNNDVSVIDLSARKELQRIPVQREPVAADLTRDGKYLLVANHLPAGRADGERVAAVVSVIDLAAGRVAKELPLPNGSGSLQDVRVSPDGRYAAVTHISASFNRATTRVQFGWLNANALTLIDLNRMELVGTVLLDTPGSGAANPWGLAWSSDSATLLVTHAGTHEVSLVDFPALLAGIAEGASSLRGGPGRRGMPTKRPSQPVLEQVSFYEGLDPGLPFLVGARRRVKLPESALGPRAASILGSRAYVANYYSDTLSVVDLTAEPAPPTRDGKDADAHAQRPAGDVPVQSIPLYAGPEQAGAGRLVCGSPLERMPLVRRGEFYFHDATLCLQGWQSCSSCHPGGARADGFNWDLLNDGLGNPKSTKSLLLAFETPPAMWLGVRQTAETAVRAGVEHILFTKQPDDVVRALCEYIKSLKPVPSPYLVQGRLSEAAKRGKSVFGQAGCLTCHPPPLFTDLHAHDVGTRAPFDKPADQFHTPTLVEVWRTAPYLHDGSAATIRDVLTTHNPRDRHGKTSALSEQELKDLCEYVLSL